MNARKFFASFLAAALAGTCGVPPSLAAPAAAPVSIGVAGAVKGLVKAVPPAGSKAVGRVVQSGKDLYLHEHVTTGPGGHLQIMLKDETIFTIGPDSDIVLDEFVYDPKTDSGKVSASVTKGVFRFITGNIGKKDPSRMQVMLPAGTIGIRGTIVAGRVTPGGPSMAVLLGPGAANTAGVKPGAFDLSNANGSVSVDKAGFGSTIQGAGVPPTPPAFIPPAQLQAILGDLAPKTMAERAEQGKQMMAERLAQKMSSDKEGGEGEPGEGGGPPMTEGQQKLAEKMMSGEPLTPEEQALARQEMGNAHMSEAEMKIAEKMMGGDALTPEEQQKVGMMMAGEQMMEQLGGKENMTPAQMKLAESMMAGNLTPDQQQKMMQNMSPEQQALMGGMLGDMPGMMPGAGPMGMEGGFQPGMPGGPPMGDMMAMMGDMAGMMAGMPMPGGVYGDFSAFGDLSQFGGTLEFFQDAYNATYQAFFQDPNYYNTPPPGGGFADGVASWDAIKSAVVSGTAVFPAQSGSFFLSTCKNATSCSGGTWGFSNVTVDFGAKTVTGTGSISVSPGPGNNFTGINDTVSMNTDFTNLTGAAVIDRVGSTGFSNYHFEVQNAGGIMGKQLQGNVNYNDPDTDGAGADTATMGGGPAIVSVRP